VIKIADFGESLPGSSGAILKSGKNEETTGQLLRRYGSLGTEMAVAVLIGAWGGHALDQWLGTTPWLLLIGIIFGVAAGFLDIGPSTRPLGPSLLLH